MTSTAEGMTVADLRRISRLLRTPGRPPLPTVEVDGKLYWVLKPYVH